MLYCYRAYFLYTDETGPNFRFRIGRRIVEILSAYVRFASVPKNQCLRASLRNYDIGYLARLDID